MDVTGKYTPIERYFKGLITLDEVIELVPDLDPEWIAEQEIQIEEHWKRLQARAIGWATFGGL